MENDYVQTAQQLPITHSPALAANLSSWPCLPWPNKICKVALSDVPQEDDICKRQKDERAQLAANPSHGTAPNSAQKVCQRQASIRTGDPLALSPVP